MKPYASLLFALLLATFAPQIQAQDLPQDTQQLKAKEIPVNPNVKIGKLDNGLTYYILKNDRPEDKLELRLVVNAGSILETENQLGLAHFMEHMNFNGTKNFEKNELVDYLQSIGVKFGADLNAYTSFDETVYILPIPSDDKEKLENGFQILEDWAHNATLTDEAIDDERGVVLEEYRLGLGPQKRMMQEYLPKLMYGSRYAERLPIGTKENLENFTYQDVRDYYTDWYRPDLMAVVAVGDLDVNTIETKIKEHFGRIAPVKDPKKRTQYELPNHEETLVAIASDKEAPFTQVQVVYKDPFPAPSITTVYDYREQLAKSLFTTMINNRLRELTQKTNPPFIFGFSYYGGTFVRNKNAYQSIASTSETGQLEALKALLTENERVKQHGFFESEFERAKSSLMAQLEKNYNDRDKQESGRLVNEYVQHYLDDQPIPGIAWEYETTKQLLPTIELAEVSDLINQFIHDDNRVIILTGPEKENLPKVTEAQVMEVVTNVETATIAPYKDEAVRENLLEKKPIPGTIVTTEVDEALQTTTFTLSNGAKLTYKKTDFKNDEILFEAFSFGGSSLLSTEEYLASVYAMNGLAEAGIGGLNQTELSKMMSGKIATVRPYVNLLTEGLSGNAAPKDLQTLFEMIHLYFTSLNKDTEAYQTYIDKQKGFLANILSNPQFYFSEELNKIQNEGNERYVGFPTPEVLDAADYDLAYAKYQERFADAGDFHFFFIGNIDEEKLKQYATIYLASLPASNSEERYNVTEYRRPDVYRKEIIYKGEDPKSFVNMIWREDDIAYTNERALLLDALGEILTIKLVETLREEEAGVYGVGARGDFRKISYPGATFTISFPCGPENVDKLVEAALKEVEKIKMQGPTMEDLNKVKEAYFLEKKENLKKNDYWLSVLVDAASEKRDASKMINNDDLINNLTQNDIQKIAQEILDENYLLGILMPEATE
jgi:zinc protease